MEAVFLVDKGCLIVQLQKLTEILLLIQHCYNIDIFTLESK
ncbi:hypothetical protein [Gudongella oleilytica]